MILFVGPDKAPITGQSYSFHKTFECLDASKSMLTFGKGRWGSVSFVLQLLLCLIMKRPEKVYLTTSRTRLGFARDSIIILTAAMMRCKIINHLHGADFQSFFSSCGPCLQEFVRFIYSKVDTSVVLMDVMKDQYSMFPKMKLVSLPNFFINETDKAEIHNHKSLFLKSPRRQVEVTYFSNIMYSKGVFDVLDAAQLCFDRGLDVEFKFAGDFVSDSVMDKEAVKSRFTSAIERLPNAKHVGLVVGKKREALLLNSDIFLFPSFYNTEALPISMLEALSCGCFIVTTKHNYLPEITPTGNLIIPTKSPERIYNAICTYVGLDEEKKMNQACANIEHAHKKYSYQTYTDSINALLKK